MLWGKTKSLMRVHVRVRMSKVNEGQRQEGMAEIQVCVGFPFVRSGSDHLQGTGRRGLCIYSDDFWEAGAARH